MRTLAAALILVLSSLGTAREPRAELKLHALFGDGMVLQSDFACPIWGSVEPGEEIVQVGVVEHMPVGRPGREVVAQARSLEGGRPARAGRGGTELHHGPRRARRRSLDLQRPVQHGMERRRLEQRGGGEGVREFPEDPPLLRSQAAGGGAGGRRRRLVEALQPGDRGQLHSGRILLRPRAPSEARRAGRSHPHLVGRHRRGSVDVQAHPRRHRAAQADGRRLRQEDGHLREADGRIQRGRRESHRRRKARA